MSNTATKFNWKALTLAFAALLFLNVSLAQAQSKQEKKPN
jgi:hypothetical protein